MERAAAVLEENDIRRLSGAVEDPLAFAVLMRATKRGSRGHRKMRLLGRYTLDVLGLQLLEPEDVINTTPGMTLAILHIS